MTTMTYSEKNKSFIDSLILKKERYYELLKPTFEISLMRWERYLGGQPPQQQARVGKQKWQSSIAIPKATANTDTVAASVSNIICSANPIIQAVRARDLEVDTAEYGEKLVSYTFRGNKLRSRILPPAIRNAEIQGMQALKVEWMDRSRRVVSNPSQEEYEHFWNEVLVYAKDKGGSFPDPEEDMEAFKAWLETARGSGADIPNMPEPTTTHKSAYMGPWYSLPAFWNLFYNPFIADPQEQEVIFERCIMPESYIKALADKKDPDSPFDMKEVEYGLKYPRSNRYTDEELKYYEMLRFAPEMLNTNEPFGEIIKAYMPTNPDAQYVCILNRCAIINVDRENPNPTGDMPFVFIQRKRNSSVAVGQSPYRHNGPLLDELNALEEAKVDAVNLVSVPAFYSKGAKGAGANSIADYQAAKIYPVSEHGEIQQIMIKVPDALFREADSLNNTIDMGWGVGGNVRGQQATVGRVTKDENQSRLAQATLPLIELAREVEDALIVTIPWVFSMFAAYADETTKLKLLNRLENLDMQKINQVLEMDFEMVGATQAGNREQLGGVLMNWLDKAIRVLRPEEARGFIKATGTLLGIPDIGSIMTDPLPMLPMPTDGTLGPNGAPISPTGAPNGGPAAANGVPPAIPGMPLPQ